MLQIADLRQTWVRRQKRHGLHCNKAAAAGARELACFAWGMMTGNIAWSHTAINTFYIEKNRGSGKAVLYINHLRKLNSGQFSWRRKLIPVNIEKGFLRRIIDPWANRRFMPEYHSGQYRSGPDPVLFCSLILTKGSPYHSLNPLCCAEGLVHFLRMEQSN